MLNDYIFSYLNKARYEIIDGGRRYYGEIPELKGVWAVGKTLESCRQELLEVLEGWIILRLRKNLFLPGFKMSRSRTKERKEIYV